MTFIAIVTYSNNALDVSVNRLNLLFNTKTFTQAFLLLQILISVSDNVYNIIIDTFILRSACLPE